jgi:hypothetical protein
MKATALCLFLLCATLAGCVVVPERSGWYHDHDRYHDHDGYHDRR